MKLCNIVISWVVNLLIILSQKPCASSKLWWSGWCRHNGRKGSHWVPSFWRATCKSDDLRFGPPTRLLLQNDHNSYYYTMYALLHSLELTSRFVGCFHRFDLISPLKQSDRILNRLLTPTSPLSITRVFRHNHSVSYSFKSLAPNSNWYAV